MSTAHTGWAIGGGLLAVAIAAATTWSAGVHSASAAPVAASSTATSSAPTTVPPAAAVPAAPASPGVGARVVPAGTSSGLSPAEAARTTAELAALARRLPAGVRLTAPAAWTSWTGGRPAYAQDVDGCPHVADRLGASLGGRWSYSQGTLPQGPLGCSWTTAPRTAGSPPADQVVVDVGYEHGSLPDLLGGTDLCSGVEAPRVAVPAVRSGALLVGCDDGTGPGVDLAVPDTGGTGVFFLHARGGTAVSGAQASAALLAVLSAARHAYA